MTFSGHKALYRIATNAPPVFHLMGILTPSRRTRRAKMER